MLIVMTMLAVNSHDTAQARTTRHATGENVLDLQA